MLAIRSPPAAGFGAQKVREAALCLLEYRLAVLVGKDAGAADILHEGCAGSGKVAQQLCVERTDPIDGELLLDI